MSDLVELRIKDVYFFIFLFFVLSVGWMCVKMNEDIVEKITAEIWKWFGKCDFTAEIQPRKTDSGTEPISVGIVWLKKTRKSYIYYIYYVGKRSFYKIHASERLPLNYAFVKSILNLIRHHLCCNMKCKRSTTDWRQLWPLTWAEMMSYARQIHGQSLGSFEKI